MQICSVNIGRTRMISHDGKRMSTGIFKCPVAGPCRVEAQGLMGDEVGDLIVHGGLNKAVYAYAVEHYAHWASVLEREDLVPGQFGENLTVEGMLEADVCIGDRYRMGTAILEVTQPRVPCVKLGIRMGLPGFPAQFMASGRLGFYLRVLEPGSVSTGDPIECLERPEEGISIQALFDISRGEGADSDLPKRALLLPNLGKSWRRRLRRQLSGPQKPENDSG